MLELSALFSMLLSWWSIVILILRRVGLGIVVAQGVRSRERLLRFCCGHRHGPSSQICASGVR